MLQTVTDPKMAATAIPAPVKFDQKRANTDLFSALLRAKRTYGGKTVAVVDGDGTEFDYQTIVRGAFALGSALKRETEKDENVGVLL
ncbi:MAG: hypothetical protein MRY64_01215, partial [Hyphomonadaceae bacterium]|nr:hypothetical protein [Hyphomonadaceae bacterium]